MLFKKELSLYFKVVRSAAPIYRRPVLSDFKNLLKGDKIILVDFYADWCLPCKKMEPFLNEIANENKEIISLIRINADEQSELCKSLKIDALPYLQLYKNENLLWEKVGFIDKMGIEKEINLIKF
jgi:thioredoxin